MICNDLNETKVLGQRIAYNLNEVDVILLKGPLGVGKTEFVRAIISSFTTDEVLSPTFTIVNNYVTSKNKIFHYDLYRLDHKNEIYNIGLEETIEQGINLVEWPEIAEQFWPKNRLEINISLLGNSSVRIYELKGYGLWEKKISVII